MSLLAFSSVSAAVSMSSTSWVICGRFPLLPPRLMLEEVELELRPESGTGDDWSSLRKSKPPSGRRRQRKKGLGSQQACRGLEVSIYKETLDLNYGYVVMSNIDYFSFLFFVFPRQGFSV